MKAILPLLALAACSAELTLDDWIYAGGDTFIQRLEIEASRGDAVPEFGFIIRIDRETTEFYYVKARIQCARDRMLILRSEHHLKDVLLSSGKPKKTQWYVITPNTPADGLKKAVCNPTETI